MLYGVYLVQLDGMIKKPRKSLPKAQAKMSEMVRAGSYLRVVDRILDALEQQVISQKDLAAIVCDGNLQRNCSGCKREITIGNVSTYAGRNKGKPAVLWHLGQDNIFSCGAEACDNLMVVRPGSETDAWHLSVYTTVNMLSSTRCDHCFLLAPPKEVHRFCHFCFYHSESAQKEIVNFFSQPHAIKHYWLITDAGVHCLSMPRSFCLTKNYCSQECRDADQAVHTFCCKNLLYVDKRKRKKGGKTKPEEAEQALKSNVRQYYQCYPNAQQLDGKHLTEFVSKGSQSRKGTEGGPSKGKKEKGHKNVSEVD